MTTMPPRLATMLVATMLAVGLGCDQQTPTAPTEPTPKERHRHRALRRHVGRNQQQRCVADEVDGSTDVRLHR